MFSRLARKPLLLLLGLVSIAIAYWLVPIRGQVLLVPDNWQQISAWPQVRVDTTDLEPGEKASLVIYDTIPWAHVKLVVGDVEGTLEGSELNSASGVYRWDWSFVVPNTPGFRLNFYHDCDRGCRAWTSASIGQTSLQGNPPAVAELIPTKLGGVFANPQRDWHNRQGWVVELTYAQLPDAEYWGIDDLAARVKAATDKGLLVLVRVDYDAGQSIPPTADYVALDSYLDYIRWLARDDRLGDVYGYIIGSSLNTDESNLQAPDSKVTPEWYARVFSGYSAPVGQVDNVIQTIRAENSSVRVLVGTVTPWRDDQNGAMPYEIDVPWLNYFHTLTAALNQTTQAKAQAGISLISPDGFAAQAPGNPDAPELAGANRADEPRTDIRPPSFQGAQAGFRVYRDWLSIINTFPYTRGLPLYITSTNTYQPATDVEPARNYPSGWLTTALEVVNQEPQVAALCWFLDYFPHDEQWELFSLTDPRGLMTNAAEEFDSLLWSQPTRTGQQSGPHEP